MFFTGQPSFCRSCYEYGHPSGECNNKIKCRLCGSPDHIARECKLHKKCDLCDQTGHLAKDCPQRMGTSRVYTFAEAVRVDAPRARSTAEPVGKVSSRHGPKLISPVLSGLSWSMACGGRWTELRTAWRKMAQSGRARRECRRLCQSRWS